MENTEAKEIMILDDSPLFREMCAVALHKSFGVVALEAGTSESELQSVSWRNVRTVITHNAMLPATRLRVVTYMKKNWPEIALVCIGLEEHQLRVTVPGPVSRAE